MVFTPLRKLADACCAIGTDSANGEGTGENNDSNWADGFCRSNEDISGEEDGIVASHSAPAASDQNNDSNEGSKMRAGSIGNDDEKQLDNEKKVPPSVPEQSVAGPSKPDGNGMATLAEAAATGCRKCKKELETGQKTRKVHDQGCPRKWKSAGGSWLKPALKHAPRSEKEESEDESGDDSEGEEDAVHIPGSLAEAAASGCRKCQKELETGEKTRKVHDEHCPRKRIGKGGNRPALKHANKSEKEETEDESDDDSEGEEDVVCVPEASLAEAAASGCRKCQKELETGQKTRKVHDEHCPRKRGGPARSALKQATRTEKEEESEDECEESEGEDVVCVPEASLAEAAASGCRKCQKELETGQKSRRVHDEHCPRKRGGRSGRAHAKMKNEHEHAHEAKSPIKSNVADGSGSSIHHSDGLSDHSTRRSMRPKSESKLLDEEENEDRTGRTRRMWTAEEDREIVKRVRLHGEGKWKLIFDNSRILRKRYENTHSEINARHGIKTRWRDKLKQMEADGEYIDLDEADDCESVGSLESDEVVQNQTTRRSVRKRSTPELFVARPSKSGLGVKEGDEELLASMSSDATAGKSELKKEVSDKAGASLAEAAASGCRKCQKELATGEKTRKEHDDHCLRKRRTAMVDEESEDESDEEEMIEERKSDESDDDKSLDSAHTVDEDGKSEGGNPSLSQVDSDDAADEDDYSIPIEEWKYTPGATRQHVMKSICDNKISDGDLTVVRIAKEGATANDILTNFFLVIPDIMSKGTHEGKVIQPDSLFMMLQVTGIACYDDDGMQVGNDLTSWNVYAQVAREVAEFWAVDTTGKHVGKVEVPKPMEDKADLDGRMVCDWWDRVERANYSARDPSTSTLVLGKRKTQSASCFQPGGTKKKKVASHDPSLLLSEREQIAGGLTEYIDSRREIIDHQVYQDLMGIVADFKAKEINAISLVCGMMTLIDGQNELILGLNEYLPGKYSISPVDLARPGPKVMQLKSKF